jgi:restriction system protein
VNMALSPKGCDVRRSNERDNMAIPDYQSLMLPVLKVASDGQEHRISEVVDFLAKEFGLTEAEREVLLPSGKQPVFNNRVHWAKTYLSQAKLLESTRRSFFKITERGRSILAENISSIDAKFLRRFDEFNVFVSGAKTDLAERQPVQTLEEKTVSTRGFVQRLLLSLKDSLSIYFWQWDTAARGLKRGVLSAKVVTAGSMEWSIKTS